MRSHTQLKYKKSKLMLEEPDVLSGGMQSFPKALKLPIEAQKK
jgi:hypothetical protein